MPSGSLSLTVADTNGSVLKTFDLLSPSENPGAFGYTNPVLQKLEGGDYLLTWMQSGGNILPTDKGQFAQVLNYDGNLNLSDLLVQKEIQFKSPRKLMAILVVDKK